MALSCGFIEIFVAIGFNGTDLLADVEGGVDPDVVAVGPDVVGVDVVPLGRVPGVVGLPVVFGAWARGVAAGGRPCESA